MWSAQLIVQPCGNVGKHFLPVGLHQQFVPGAGVQLAADVLHACGLQALDGAQHALAPVAHRVGGAGQEQQAGPWASGPEKPGRAGAGCR